METERRTFCNEQKETLKHLFFDCCHVRTFLLQLQEDISVKCHINLAMAPDTSSLQCYSVLSDIRVKIELCIPLESKSYVLPTGNASVCLSPQSKLKFAVLFCSICKELISFSAILF